MAADAKVTFAATDKFLPDAGPFGISRHLQAQNHWVTGALGFAIGEVGHHGIAAARLLAIGSYIDGGYGQNNFVIAGSPLWLGTSGSGARARGWCTGPPGPSVWPTSAERLPDLWGRPHIDHIAVNLRKPLGDGIDGIQGLGRHLDREVFHLENALYKELLRWRGVA